MRRFFIPGLVVGAALALLALLTFGVSNQGTNTSIDSAVSRGLRPRAPNAHMALPVLGSTRSESLAAFRGKVVVLNVFASWCVPCRSEAVILDREQQTLVKHNATIIGVTYQDTTGDAATFARQEHITYPLLRDVSGSFSRSWGVDGVPETFVIDRRGRVAAVRRYQLAGSWLAQTVSEALAQAS
jgi:cytochrome c biogenesis protein CcmG, thiol:disulfide interchange protein DsbE